MLFNLRRRRGNEISDYGYLCQMQRELQALENENRELQKKNDILVREIRIYKPDFEPPEIQSLEEKWQAKPLFEDGDIVCVFPPEVEVLQEYHEPESPRQAIDIIVKTDGTIREKGALLSETEPEAISLRSAITPLSINQPKPAESADG